MNSCCKSTGYRFVFDCQDRDAFGSIVFRCDCSLGRAKFSTGVPLWSPSLSKRFSDTPVHLPKEQAPDEQKQVVETSKPIVKPEVLSGDEKAFLRQIRESKEFTHPRFKEILVRVGKEAVKEGMKSGV